MNFWPPKPGSTVRMSTMSMAARKGTMACTGVAGLMAMPQRIPEDFTAPISAFTAASTSADADADASAPAGMMEDATAS